MTDKEKIGSTGWSGRERHVIQPCVELNLGKIPTTTEVAEVEEKCSTATISLFELFDGATMLSRATRPATRAAATAIVR